MSKNKKLISVRVNPDTLEKIEEFVSRHQYYNRNLVIDMILAAVVNHFGDRDIWDMCRSDACKANPITAIFKIHDLPKPVNR